MPPRPQTERISNSRSRWSRSRTSDAKTKYVLHKLNGCRVDAQQLLPESHRLMRPLHWRRSLENMASSIRPEVIRCTHQAFLEGFSETVQSRRLPSLPCPHPRHSDPRSAPRCRRNKTTYRQPSSQCQADVARQAPH
jgi:hypothetical protein